MSLEENWDYSVDFDTFENHDFSEFEVKLKRIHEQVNLEDCFKNQRCKSIGTITQSNDDELKAFTEKNKQLRNDIDNKLEELSKLKSRYEIQRKDQKLLSQQIKETHEAFLMAKKHYKRFLKIYYSIETKDFSTQTIFVQFFTETKKESENYSIRLLRDTKTGFYELIRTNPKLQTFKELHKQLQETNDVPGLLCCIWHTFKIMKKSKI